MACYENIPLKASYFKSLTGKEKLARMKAKTEGLMVFISSHGQMPDPNHDSMIS